MGLLPLWNSYGPAAIFVVTTTVLLLFPILGYVWVGWKYKSLDIITTINDNAKREYLIKFHKTESSDLPSARASFLKLYYRRFGRRHFIAPICLITILVILEASLAIESLGHFDANFWKPRIELNAVALSAIAGAYMWVVGDFISRTRRMDFSPADIMWGSLRLFIAAPMGLSLASIFEPHVIAFVAFGLGAFPFETVQLALRQLSYNKLGLELGPTEENELLHLNGIDKVLADRLANQDITSIVQLSYCDPIQMTMRSNLSFNAVADLVSQALAWNYIDEKLNAIRPLGFRGSFEIRQLMEDLKRVEPVDRDPRQNPAQEAKNLVPSIAARLGLTEEQIWYLFGQIAYDPYTEFIYSTWEPLGSGSPVPPASLGPSTPATGRHSSNSTLTAKS